MTPEGIDLGVELADIGARFGAFVIDLIVIVALLIAMSIGAFYLLRASGPSVAGVIWMLGFFGLRNLYFIAFEASPRAATLGKRVVGLRVVARDGGRLTADAVVARNLMREIEVVLPLVLAAQHHADGLTLWLGIGWTIVFAGFPFFNRDRLRIGDLLAGTWVIRTGRRKLGRDLMTTVGDEQFSAAELEAYGVYELETLETVLRGRDAKPRALVATAIAARIGRADPADPDAFLNAYYGQLRAHLEDRLLLGRRRSDKHDAG